MATFRVATLFLAGVGAMTLAAAASCAHHDGSAVAPSPSSFTVVAPSKGAPPAASPSAPTGRSAPTPVASQPDSGGPSDALIELARSEGSISVIVTLDIQDDSSPSLGSTAADHRRADILTAQDELAASIPQATVTARMTDFPQIVFRVNEEALRQLAASPLVLAIELNESTGPTG